MVANSRPPPPPYPIPPTPPPEVKSFAVHVVHHPQDWRSVAAKNALKKSFCEKFGIPCVATFWNETLLHLTDDFVVSVPFDKFNDVASFFMQHRVARLNPPAEVDLDLMVHPNTGAGAAVDWNFALWAGAHHPVDMNAVYKKHPPPLGSSVSGNVSENDDQWAYSCSYDASGKGQWVDLCSKGPFALNTTCRNTSRGAHIHFYYSEANADEKRAKDKFIDMATMALNLSKDICHDDYGHEQPHDKTCWLGGPTGPPHAETAALSGPPGGGSFVASHFSLYITNDDFAKVVSFVMLNDVSEIIGKSLNFLLHPIFGCNFADHQMWSLHKGFTPNNMYGIAVEGGWEGKSPPRLDPFGASASVACSRTHNLCESPSVSAYRLHLLYNATGDGDSTAKNELVDKIAVAFDRTSVQFVKDVPYSFLDPESPFLAGQVHYRVKSDSLGKVMEWLAVHRNSIDVLLTPVTCCGKMWDYTTSSMWAGRQWPLNEAALRHEPLHRTLAESFLPDSSLMEDQMPSNTDADHDFLLYVNYALANAYQVAAVENFLSAFAKRFNLDRKECTSLYPNVEPHGSKLCMMNEVTTPDTSDPITTAFARIYVPAANATEVFSYAITHRSADILGYQIDMLMVPLTDSALYDYAEHAFHIGTPWGLNDAALLASTSSGETRALNLPVSVQYYRTDNVDQYTKLSNGAIVRRWNVEGDLQADWQMVAPFMILLEIPVGETFPSWAGSYWFQGDTFSTVISGTATFTKGGIEYQYGDLFWAMAGHAHGPITNVGNVTLVVSIISSAPLLVRRAHDGPSDVNPSVNEALNTSRGYRQVDGGWSPNPSPHTSACMRNGGVQNMGFRGVDNTPAVLRVKWAPNCSIPYHYHPTGALYWILYGKMFFKGDLTTGGENIAFHSGEVRWVRPGFDYGPEYNSEDEQMEITVIGTDTPPMFQSPPPGPYKYQKTTTVTAVFDEL